MARRHRSAAVVVGALFLLVCGLGSGLFLVTRTSDSGRAISSMPPSRSPGRRGAALPPSPAAGQPAEPAAATHPLVGSPVEVADVHPRCDPAAPSCRVQRPALAFDAFRQAELAPEMLLLARRRVSRLFVVPPPRPLAAPTGLPKEDRAVESRAARAAVTFALWLLTAVDAQGAVVLTARSAGQYAALCAGLAEARSGGGWDAGAWGNVFVAPVSFVPEAAAAAARAVPAGGSEPDALLWHLAGLDAAEERYEPDTVVLFDAAPLTAGDVAGGVSGAEACGSKAYAEGREAPRAVESVVSGAALFDGLRRSAWRYWFVESPSSSSAARDMVWRLAPSSAPGLPSVAALLAARLGPAPQSAWFHDFNVSHALTPAVRRCGLRRYEGAVVQLAGSSDVVTIDNALNVLVRNPQWIVVVAAAFSEAVVAKWLRPLPAFYLANVRVHSGGVLEQSCRGFQQRNAQSLHLEHSEARNCVGAMAIASPGNVLISELAPSSVVVIMPIRDATVFGGSLARAFLGGPAAAAPVSTVIPVGNPTAPIVVVVATTRLESLVSMNTQGPSALAKLVGTKIASDIAAAHDRGDTALSGFEWVHTAVDLSKLGPSPSAKRSPQWAERPGSAWTTDDAMALLNGAEAAGAVIAYPVSTMKQPQNGPWRYHIRRRRVDPTSVRALDPQDKAKLWCHPETLEGCAPTLVDKVRRGEACSHRSLHEPARDPIKCDVRDDDRVRREVVRPLQLRRPMPTVVGPGLNLTNEQLAETAGERDVDPESKEAGHGTARVPVDVLISVITHGHGPAFADDVEVAESWLEYCPTCVLVYAEGDVDPDAGELYDRLKRELAPDVFDRLIINPKPGLKTPTRAPLLYRHLHNVKYARCFVAPLRVMMVASNQAPFRAGLAEYLLSHSATSLRDVHALVAEADKEDAWADPWLLSAAPRLTQASQQLVYGSEWTAFEWAPLGLYYCSGRSFYSQTRTGLSSVLGFEGLWYTGAQWRAFDSAFQLGYWLHDVGFPEHSFPQVALLEEELRRAYSSNRTTTTTAPSPLSTTPSPSSLSSTTKPSGRNTCLLEGVRRRGTISLEELRRSMEERAQGFHFSVKRVSPFRNDSARAYLRAERKRAIGKPAEAATVDAANATNVTSIASNRGSTSKRGPNGSRPRGDRRRRG